MLRTSVASDLPGEQRTHGCDSPYPPTLISSRTHTASYTHRQSCRCTGATHTDINKYMRVYIASHFKMQLGEWGEKRKTFFFFMMVRVVAIQGIGNVSILDKLQPF